MDHYRWQSDTSKTTKKLIFSLVSMYYFTTADALHKTLIVTSNINAIISTRSRMAKYDCNWLNHSMNIKSRHGLDMWGTSVCTSWQYILYYCKAILHIICCWARLCQLCEKIKEDQHPQSWVCKQSLTHWDIIRQTLLHFSYEPQTFHAAPHMPHTMQKQWRCI